MRISAKTKLSVIIGDPVDHSLSPAMHNAAYESLNIDDRFVYLGASVKVENVKTVVEAVRVMNIRGLTCTMPHKIEIMKYLDVIDPAAKKMGAVNTVVNDNGILKGYNTDWLGAVTPLEKITKLKKKNVAILGAGGAARAITYGMISRKAHVTIYNRTVKKAEELAHEFNCIAKPMDQIDEISKADIIINATSVGMHPNKNILPFNQQLITKNQIVFDIIYVPYETRLLKFAKEKGATVIHGLEMLLYQGTAQFELYTNRKAPETVMRKVLMEYTS